MTSLARFLVVTKIVSLMLLIACNTPNAAQELSFRNLAKGTFSGIEQRERQVIRTDSAWKEFWAKHSSKTAPATEAPAVDFKDEMVIAVTMGRQRTGGYAIEITKIEKRNSHIRVHLKTTQPDPGGFTIQALTAPFHFVAAPKTEGKPEFVETE